MNKMNLPPPFEELETEFPMLKEIYDIEKYKDILNNDIISKSNLSMTNSLYLRFLIENILNMNNSSFRYIA